MMSSQNNLRKLRKKRNRRAHQVSGETNPGAIKPPQPGSGRMPLYWNQEWNPGFRPALLLNSMPESLYITLRGTKYGYLANVGSLYNSDFLKMNDALNADDAGTINMVPFGEFAAFFNAYRTINFRVKITFMSLEAFPEKIGLVPSIASLGTNNSLFGQYLTNTYAKSKHISAKGGMDRATIKFNMCLPEYVGSSEYINNPAYSAAIGAAPSTLVYLNYGTVATNNTVLGTEYDLEVEMDVLFFKKDMFNS